MLKHYGKSLGNKSPKYKGPSVTFSCLKRESWTHRSVFLLQVFLLLAVCMGQARVVLLVRVVVLVVVVVEPVLVQVQAQPIRHSAGLLLAQRSCLVLSPLVRLQGHVLLPKTDTFGLNILTHAIKLDFFSFHNKSYGVKFISMCYSTEKKKLEYYIKI